MVGTPRQRPAAAGVAELGLAGRALRAQEVPRANVASLEGELASWRDCLWMCRLVVHDTPTTTDRYRFRCRPTDDRPPCTAQGGEATLLLDQRGAGISGRVASSQ
jgi:hypothetical protein